MADIRITYNQSINGIKNARVKGLTAEVSALIEESVQNGGKESMIPKLFLERKSDNAVERVAIEDSLGLMEPTVDGDKPNTDQTNQIGEKSVSHVIYTKEVTLTRSMIDDARATMNPSIEIKARSIPDSYFDTRELVAQNSFIKATDSSWRFGKAKIDLTTYDGKPLFATNHDFGDEIVGHDHGTQSNLFYVSMENYNAGDIAELLATGASVIDQMKNANGVAQGFKADTIFVPSSLATTHLRQMVQRATGSEYFPGGSDNDINTQHNQWTICPLRFWDAAEDEIIIMSQKAKDQMKSMFYNRVALDVDVYRDPGTRSLHWNAYTRFSTVHVDYKHCIRIKINPKSEDGLTLLTI
ncbi:MAG: hypothetical protein J6L83_05470 [Clostridia bacterium]|nr:hypothetical protein [Clostridia bacterium]